MKISSSYVRTKKFGKSRGVVMSPTNSPRFASPAARGLAKVWRLSLAMLLGIIVSAASRPVRGQAVNATLLGTVTDSSGAAVAGAKITITEVKTGIGHSATTHDSGKYEVPDLPPGRYEFVEEKQGFRQEVHMEIESLWYTDVRLLLV